MPRKPKPKVKDMVVDMESMGLPHSIVDMEADIFAGRSAKIIFNPPIEVTKSEYEEIFEQLESVYSKVESSLEKLDKLRKLFRVEQTGDLLDCGYKIIFNTGIENSWDELGDSLLKKFIDNYSLDISTITKDLRRVKDVVEAKLMRGKAPYCEVDLLFNEKKEPVEC